MANLFDQIKDLTKSAVDKGTEVVELGKLKAKIAQEESNIAQIKEQIGNYYWEHYVAGKQLDEPVMKWCRDIEASQSVIAATHNEVKHMKQDPSDVKYEKTTNTCRACGHENAPETKFCGNCGVRLS